MPFLKREHQKRICIICDCSSWCLQASTLAITRPGIAHDLVRLLVMPFMVTKWNQKRDWKKKLACANCLKRTLSEMMVPAKEHEILKRIWPRLLQRKFLKRIRSEKTDPVKDSSLKRSYEVSWCFRMIALNQSNQHMSLKEATWNFSKSYGKLSKVMKTYRKLATKLPKLT